MAKQYHFVVQFDTETKEFSLDIDTLTAKFHSGVMFDKDTQEWISSSDADDYEQTDYLAKEDILAGWLQKVNEVLEEEG